MEAERAEVLVTSLLGQGLIILALGGLEDQMILPWVIYRSLHTLKLSELPICLVMTIKR